MLTVISDRCGLDQVLFTSPRGPPIGDDEIRERRPGESGDRERAETEGERGPGESGVSWGQCRIRKESSHSRVELRFSSAPRRRWRRF